MVPVDKVPIVRVVPEIELPVEVNALDVITVGVLAVAVAVT
jgi:hypothetical protein